VPINRYLSLRFPVTGDGQQRKGKSVNFLLQCGWRIVGETIEPGHMKGDEACCLAMICLPLGFAAGRTEDVVTVNLQYEGSDDAVASHEHVPVQLDFQPTVACAVCSDILSEAQIREVRQLAQRRAQERADAESQARAALREQCNRENKEKQAARKAYLDAHPDERKKHRDQLLLIAAGATVGVLIVIVIALVMSHPNRETQRKEHVAARRQPQRVTPLTYRTLSNRNFSQGQNGTDMWSSREAMCNGFSSTAADAFDAKKLNSDFASLPGHKEISNGTRLAVLGSTSWQCSENGTQWQMTHVEMKDGKTGYIASFGAISLK
jgi:hypothetical protein